MYSELDSIFSIRSSILLCCLGPKTDTSGADFNCHSISLPPPFFTLPPAPFTDASHVMIIYTPCATLTPTWTKGRKNSPCLEAFSLLAVFATSLVFHSFLDQPMSYSTIFPYQVQKYYHYRPTYRRSDLFEEEEIKENCSQKGNTAQIIKKSCWRAILYLSLIHI